MHSKPQPGPEQFDWQIRDSRAQLALCVLWTLGLIAFGWFCHPIEIIGGESDQYVPRAEMLLQGSVPKDTFHPLLFPVLTAGLGLLVGDCFVAGRIVSSLAAGVFVFFAARLMGVMFGRGQSGDPSRYRSAPCRRRAL